LGWRNLRERRASQRLKVLGFSKLRLGAILHGIEVEAQWKMSTRPSSFYL
jgi:hypothetical protein